MEHQDKIRVGLLQMDISWEDPAGNKEYIERKLNDFQGPLNLLVLPEMFTTGFTMEPKSLAERMEGETVRWMQQLASAKGMAITGSLVIEQNGNFYNRLVFVKPDGKITFYDKRHLFTLSGEDEKYTRGTGRVIVLVGSFRICLQVCYDLRFPAFVRYDGDYDAILYVANWPSARILAWETLLNARAIENSCYVVGANRIGVDPNENEYTGQSKIVDFTGAELISAESNDGIFTAEMSKNDLDRFRDKFGFLEDRDQVTVR